jgi:transposase
MQSYSQDLRDRVLWALGRGERPPAIARRLEVSRIWVYQVRNREQQTGKRTSFQIGGHRRSRVAEMESVLRAWIEREPDLALAELCERLARQGVLIKAGAHVSSARKSPEHNVTDLNSIGCLTSCARTMSSRFGSLTGCALYPQSAGNRGDDRQLRRTLPIHLRAMGRYYYPRWEDDHDHFRWNC